MDTAGSVDTTSANMLCLPTDTLTGPSKHVFLWFPCPEDCLGKAAGERAAASPPRHTEKFRGVTAPPGSDGAISVLAFPSIRGAVDSAGGEADVDASMCS